MAYKKTATLVVAMAGGLSIVASPSRGEGEPDVIFQDMFRDNIRILSGQRRSRLLMACMVEPDFMEGRTFYFDQIGQVDAQTKQGRAPETPMNFAPHYRRQAQRTPKHINIPLDSSDWRRIMRDPRGKYVEIALRAHGKTVDDSIIRALGGNSTSVDGEGAMTSIALPAGQKIAHGGTGMTVAKLRAAKKILDANEAGTDDAMGSRKLYCGLTSEQVDNLLGQTEVGSADYNAIKALVDGEVTHFMGFDFIRTERFIKNGNNRHCYAWTGEGIGCGSDPAPEKVRIGELPDRSYTWSAYLEWEVGAIRVEEKHVVEITCQE